MPQRGHREGKGETNRGNFLEILELVASHDDIVKKRTEEGPKNAKYTHHSIQDVLVRIMADVILSEITKEVSNSKYYSIIADETKDLSKKEQISIVLRYLHNKIHEEFIGFPTQSWSMQKVFANILQNN